MFNVGKRMSTLDHLPVVLQMTLGYKLVEGNSESKINLLISFLPKGM
jgi:hypothetical protein